MIITKYTKYTIYAFKYIPKTSQKDQYFPLRNNFIAGVVVLIPIGITLYLTLFIIKISSKILPKEINPNYYLPYNILV